jgi:tmRNA-binding protein
MSAKKDKNKHKDAPSAVNKKAYRNFEFIEKFEAGLALLGSEVQDFGQAMLARWCYYSTVSTGRWHKS